MSHGPQQTKQRLRPLLLICALGVALRAALLCLAGDLELQSDEANYLYLGLTWNHFGFYFDQHRYLWPPGYSWLMAHLLEVFGYTGIMAAKILQVLASASIGLTTMLFAGQLFGSRAARTAGFLWVGYLPLAAFTHTLWNETLFVSLFLPALYQIFMVMRGAPASTARVLCAGLLLACSLYLKEAPQFLVLVYATLLLVTAHSALEGVRRTSLLLLLITAALLPWSLRNKEVYGVHVPLGTSLGENIFNGLNEDYRNFDLIAIDVERERRGQSSTKNVSRPFFTHIRPTPYAEYPARLEELSTLAVQARARALDPGLEEDKLNAHEVERTYERAKLRYQRLEVHADGPPPPDKVIDLLNGAGWNRAEPPEVINVVARSDVNTARGIAFAREHPSWFLRSRVKKLADFVTPLSFFTRHMALGHYDSTALGGDLVRKLLSLWAVLCPIIVIPLGIAGYIFALRDRSAWLLFGLTFGYFLSTTLLVAMSRFRLPTVPLLMVLTAGFLCSPKGRPTGGQLIAATVSATLLMFLWWVGFPESWLVFSDMVWTRYEP